MSAVPEDELRGKLSDSELEQRQEKWTCDSNNKRVRFLVRENDSFWEVPTIEVETEVADGITPRDTFTRAVIPFEWRGETTAELFDTWGQRTPSDETYDICKVEWYDEDKEEWELVQTGWLRGVGGTDTQNCFKAIVSGFEQVFKHIGASKKLDTTNYEDVIRVVIDELDSSGFTDIYDLQFSANLEQTQDTERTAVVFLKNFFTKEFKSNEDTVVDVLEYLTEKTNSVWYLDNEGNLRITQNVTPSNLSGIDNDYYIDESAVLGNLSDDVNLGSPDVFNIEVNNNEVDIPEKNQFTNIENNALKEISPINTVWVSGDSVGSLGREFYDLINNRWEGNYPDATSKYPFAVAWYPPLMANEPSQEKLLGDEINSVRAGIGKEFTTDGKTLNAVENTAKKRLKEEIRTIGEGDMTISGKPSLVPRDKVIAYPIKCSSVVARDAMTYKVDSVKHVQKGGGDYQSIVDCTVFVDEEQIETASTAFE